jgi:stage II sporulation protein D
MLEGAPEVRVLIVEVQRSLRVRIPATFSVGVSDRSEPLAEIDRGGDFTVRNDRGEAVLAQGSRRVVSSEVIIVRPRSDKPISVNGRPYRGGLIVRADKGGVIGINVVDIDDYIKGVLPSEIGYLESNQYAAFCAQAIAARSYALSKLDEKKGDAYDLNATITDQVYTGVLGEHEMASKAVDETRGLVCMFLGEPVRTYYSACCGGHTADIRVGWPWKTPYPYLYGVRDTVPGTMGRSLCRDSKHFRWRVHWSGAALAGILRRTLPRELGINPKDIGNLENINVLGTAPDGRAIGIEIVTDRGTYQVLGDRIRWVLRPDPDSDAILKSTLFTMEVSRLGNRIASVDILGGGNGHGIGMCQTGAVRMAELGYSPAEILRHYYPGARIQRLYR